MSDLMQFSNDLAGLVENIGQSTVRIEARRRHPATGIVWSADGVIVTAHHVVERDENIQVGLPNGEKVAATLVGRDPSTDIAVLRTQASGLAVPAWADPASLKVGHLVLALGRPGDDMLSTFGVISALGDAWRTNAGGRVDRYIQPDVAMYPGFSGGPLVTMDGEVAGLNTSATMRDTSLTIPGTTLRRVVESLLTHGKMRRGYLGVSTQPVRLPAALEKQLGQETGLLIVNVAADSPADKGGLMLGDTIIALDNQPVRQMDDLLGLLGVDTVGVSTPVRVVRGGQVQEVTVTIGQHD